MSLGVLKCGDVGPVTLGSEEGASLVVGRAVECALQLSDKGVSRRHIEVFVLHGMPHVRSLRPVDMADVLVNGSELSVEPRPLADGDTLQLTGADGDYSLVWSAAATDEATVKVRPGCESRDLGRHTQQWVTGKCRAAFKTRCHCHLLTLSGRMSSRRRCLACP
jgi:hypothetical protein